MTQDEFTEASALVQEVELQDHKVGRVLAILLHHIADVAGMKELPTETTPGEVTPAEGDEHGN